MANALGIDLTGSTSQIQWAEKIIDFWATSVDMYTDSKIGLVSSREAKRKRLADIITDEARNITSTSWWIDARRRGNEGPEKLAHKVWIRFDLETRRQHLDEIRNLTD